MSSPEAMLLSHILEDDEIMNGMYEEIVDFYKKTEIEKWLTQTQARMLSEILSSGTQDDIISRLNNYKGLQEKRNSDWIKKKVDGKSAVDIFIEMIKNLYNDCVKDIIKESFEDKDIRFIFQEDAYKNLIYETLVGKFNYLFMLIYKEQGCGQNV
jgi:hypothetical protein